MLLGGVDLAEDLEPLVRESDPRPAGGRLEALEALRQLGLRHARRDTLVKDALLDGNLSAPSPGVKEKGPLV